MPLASFDPPSPFSPAFLNFSDVFREYRKRPVVWNGLIRWNFKCLIRQRRIWWEQLMRAVWNFDGSKWRLVNVFELKSLIRTLTEASWFVPYVNRVFVYKVICWLRIRLKARGKIAEGSFIFSFCCILWGVLFLANDT